jgi:diguanylate cyclase (GGDEF)-like protein
MSNSSHPPRAPRKVVPRFAHSWVPVVLALVVAVVAGWSIIWLIGSSARVSQAKHAVPGLQVDVARPEGLLLDTAARRVRATGRSALAPTPGVPLHEAVFYNETFRRIEGVGTGSGETRLARDVVRALRDMAVTQDGVYGGGNGSLLASKHAPVAVQTLQSSFSALNARVARRALVWEWFARGGTMFIMLAAALALIALLRRFDRMRGRLTEELHVLASHDPLTGLANRRQLSNDLADAIRSATPLRPATLVAFDLDGFKAYNDAFGHHGGDLLLTRLSRALALAAVPDGTAYRLGGDEFCVLFTRGADQHALTRCVAALSETGDAFSITSSHGSVVIPTEADDPDVVMQLADERMYAEKNSSRASTVQQTRSLALKVLSVQEPDVEHHSAHVATLADAVGRRLALGDSEREDLVRAAELHDIGKIAIPYAVLHKPTALDDGEWEMMRRHPTIGANILSAAPALGRVAEIVRHSHERYDGNGYPAGLAGTEIPLASRIVFVCDSFDAMVSPRPYSRPMSDEGALDELRRNAGTQFDPAVVAAFCAAHHSQTVDHRASEPEPVTQQT